MITATTESPVLADKVVWVTGAGKGLGRAIAVALSRAGAVVAVSSRTPADLRALANELAPALVTVLPISVDDAAAVRGAVAEILERHGRLDALVNCAGISSAFVRSETLDDDDWARVLGTNLTGTFLCCREAGKVMIEQGRGSIVNVSSVYASVGFERMAAYAASKGGVEALTKSLAVEWAPKGIRVNTLAPGYFHTDLSSGLLESRWKERITSSIPLGRVGNPVELTGAAVFLVSDAASYVTGSTLTVDGGWTSW